MTTEITRIEDRMLSPRELSERIGIGEEQLSKWRGGFHQVRQGPPFLRLGDGPTSPVRYLLSDVLAWEESRRCHVPEVPTVEAEYERQKAS